MRPNEVVLVILEIFFSLGVVSEKSERKRDQLLVGLGICEIGRASCRERV